MISGILVGLSLMVGCASRFRRLDESRFGSGRKRAWGADGSASRPPLRFIARFDRSATADAGSFDRKALLRRQQILDWPKPSSATRIVIDDFDAVASRGKLGYVGKCAVVGKRPRLSARDIASGQLVPLHVVAPVVM